jgi:probable F420-dependent oxidoreductase
MPKVLVGALGPRMTEMAAEVSDGILVMPFNSARHMRERTLPAIDRGLATAKRTRGDIELTAEVIVGCGRTDEELERAMGVRNLLAFYGSTPSYRPVLDVEGWGDLQPELNRLSKQGEWAEMANLVTDDMVATLAVHGTPDQCAREIVDRFGADVSRICAYFPFSDPSDELIAEFTSAVKRARQ